MPTTRAPSEHTIFAFRPIEDWVRSSRLNTWGSTSVVSCWKSQRPEIGVCPLTLYMQSDAWTFAKAARSTLCRARYHSSTTAVVLASAATSGLRGDADELHAVVLA